MRTFMIVGIEPRSAAGESRTYQWPPASTTSGDNAYEGNDEVATDCDDLCEAIRPRLPIVPDAWLDGPA